MTFKLKMKKYKSIPVVKIIGDMASQNITILSKKLEALSQSNHDIIVVDLNETTYIDSHGLGVMVYAWKMMEKKNKRLIFLNSQEFLRSMFEGTNLDQVLTIVDDLEKL